jgi:hypothetical protein
VPDISATRPVAGAAIETAWGQQLHDAVETVLGARTALGPHTSSYAIPYSTPGVIPDTTVSAVPAGTHLVIAAVDIDATSGGFGIASVYCQVGGVAQTPAIDFAGAAGTRATIVGVWLVTLAAAADIRLAASKSLNAGTAQAVLDKCTLTVL